jgi:hypothetical protein
MINFNIIEIPEESIGADTMSAFKYMVEETSSGSRWFGSNSYTDCENYIIQYSKITQEYNANS